MKSVSHLVMLFTNNHNFVTFSCTVFQHEAVQLVLPPSGNHNRCLHFQSFVYGQKCVSSMILFALGEVS